jgi:hypothetical protein
VPGLCLSHCPTRIVENLLAAIKDTAGTHHPTKTKRSINKSGTVPEKSKNFHIVQTEPLIGLAGSDYVRDERGPIFGPLLLEDLQNNKQKETHEENSEKNIGKNQSSNGPIN